MGSIRSEMRIYSSSLKMIIIAKHLTNFSSFLLPIPAQIFPRNYTFIHKQEDFKYRKVWPPWRKGINLISEGVGEKRVKTVDVASMTIYRSVTVFLRHTTYKPVSHFTIVKVLVKWTLRLSRSEKLFTTVWLTSLCFMYSGIKMDFCSFPHANYNTMARPSLMHQWHLPWVPMQPMSLW